MYDLLTRHMAADSRVVVVLVVAFVVAAAVRTCHVSEMIIYLSLQSNSKKKREKRKKKNTRCARSRLSPFAPMAYA